MSRSFGLSGRAAPVTRILLIACVAVFVLQLLADRFFDFTGWFGLSPRLLVRGAAWQAVTYMFLHGGIMHLLFNMLALWVFGSEVERSMGPRRYAVFWFFCGIGAGLCSLVAAWGSPVSVVGASGAIFGVLLAYGAFFPDRPVTLLLFLIVPVTLTARWLVAIFAGVEVLILLAASGRSPGNVAHLGGLLFAVIFLRGPDAVRAVRSAFLARRIRAHDRSLDRTGSERRRLQAEIDSLLEKISRQGMAGLSEDERRRLYAASERLKRI
jgi:membrane associated rhomboid family serine protease